MRTTLLLAACFLTAASAATAQEKKAEPDIIARLKKAKLDGPFTMLVHLELKKDADLKKILSAAKSCVDLTRKEKGCVAYELHQDLENPRKFVFYEKWKSPKDLAEHLDAAHTKMLLGVLGPAIEGAPAFTVYKSAE